ncbi:putative secreted protein with PEP-CTERM sorting signal [Pseudoduganella flava]|nr:FxDxF family PEP-CTERM protein [Pseudoduganella flava]TWI40743.1 putative secreted protein with PEP-CTERM sorting signal [Pseudoduganella flava]
MKLSSIALAAALAVSGAAYADNSTTNVNLGGDANGTLSAHFGVTHTEAVDFVDVFNFTPSNGSWFVDSSLVTIGFQPGSNIDFYSAEINGHAMTLSPTGTFEYGWMLNEPIPGPLVLTVYGTAEGLMGAASASYSGTINVSPIPEPSTYGMLLGGMGILAWLARRKYS